jgi:hypothetical protein
MKRFYGALGWLFALFILCALSTNQALGQASVTNAACLASTVDGVETGTLNTQFIFRATIRPSSNMFGIIPASVRVIIDPVDPANPEFGGAQSYPMTLKPNQVPPPDQLWVAYIPGASMGLGSHSWAIIAQEGPAATGGVLMNGTGAGPKPAQQLRVVRNAGAPGAVTLMPVDQNFIDDKRATPGQIGGGLRLDPFDSTAPQDGGSSHIFTWRVRVKTEGGIPLQLPVRRQLQEWRDVRDQFDNPLAVPLLSQYNSSLILVLIDPSGAPHYCHMEFDPESPSGQLTWANVYNQPAVFPDVQGSVTHPVGGGAVWGGSGTGAYYRYRLIPTQYQFSWGGLRGEGPYTAFGGPTQPDLLPAIPLGMRISGEVIGRPYTNQYTAFAGPDRTTPMGNFGPPFPYYTDTAGRSGQWRYYYMCSTDLRPVRRIGFPSNGDITRYPGSAFSPADSYGADPGGYNYTYESDNGLGPSSPATPYVHPMVTPILSDGGWTDDIPENGYPAGISGMSHRSRPTTKTRVRFQVRVTKADNSPLPAQGVRVYIDGQPFSMQILPRPGNNDFLQGIVFYYDTQFSEGKQGQHYIYFYVDDGVHRTIWPRRDTPENGSGDARYFDPQAALAPYVQTAAQYNTSNVAVQFGTNFVFRNFLNEPRVNNRPVLSNPSVTPPSGSYGQPFTYEVLYTDADNDPPLNADVVVDGQAHRMTRASEDAGKTYAQGVRYRFIMTSLVSTPDDKHVYYFRFRDNWNNLAAYEVSDQRREYGEWQTLPPGDDNGNPAHEITGPTIIGNRPTELTEAHYFGSDQAHTPATLYDFVVKYKDADNNPPATLKVYLSGDNGATWDTGTDMVPAEGSTNYIAGVLYHLSQRKKLPVGGPYLFKFQASDGVQTTDTTLVHVGTRQTAVTDGTAHELKLIGGSPTVYGDPNETLNYNSTKAWYNDPSTIYLWKKNGSTYTLLTYGVDYIVDFVNGQVTLAAATSDKIYASYFYSITVGPQITPNQTPTLTVPDPGNTGTNEGTLTPTIGSPTTTFRYEIIYTDLDNQAPCYVNVVIDTNTTLGMTMDPSTPAPPDYTRGVKYFATTQLAVGNHNYHFEAFDGADVVRLPKTTDNPSELTGPLVTDSSNLINPLIQHKRGQIDDTGGPQTQKSFSDDKYTFTITYKNANGNAPPQGGIELRLRNQLTGTTTTALMNPIDPIGPNEFKAGVRYQVQLTQSTLPPTVAGTYDVTFGFASNPLSGTNPLVLTINGRPVLSGPGASPNPASQAGDIVLGISYSDANGDPPSAIKLFIDGTEYTAVTPTTVPAAPTTADFRTGVLYQWTIQAKNLSIGSHNFYFTAKDDLEDANPNPVPTPPGASFSIVAAKFPELLEPGGDATNNNGTLTPLAGSKTQNYTFSVKYRHLDGVAPSTIDVTLDPGTANERVVALAATGTPTAAELQAGVIYSVVLNDVASGAHTYRFNATDRLAPAAGHSVSLRTPPAPDYVGPTVNFVPALSQGTVFRVGAATPPTVNASNVLTPAQNGNILTKWVFQVVYSDQNGAPPAGGYVRVTINGSQVIDLAPKAGDPLNYTTGVIYTSNTSGTTLSAGQKAFHFDAFDGQDTARFPAAAGTDITGLTVANIPVLEPINASGDPGTVSPISGPLSTVFTYRIIYKNADNTPPAYVRVLIDGQPHDMTKTNATATNYAAGVEYRFQYRFASDTNHTYSFEAVDTVSTDYTAKYPATGVINGPLVNVPVFVAPTFSMTPGKLGVPLTVSSSLQANGLDTNVAVKLIAPDGSGKNGQAAAVIDPAHPELGAQFKFTFTPDATGDWKIQFAWGGSAGTFDPLTTEFPFKVVMEPILVNPGLDFISSPLIPVSPSPELSFAPTLPGTSGGPGGTETPAPITDLNLIKWVPNGSGGGQYLLLNQNGNFPGITAGQGYWVKPDKALHLNPKGRLWDQAVPFDQAHGGGIPLQTGWNMIGSVYMTDINWSAVKARVNGVSVSLTDASSPVRPVAWTWTPGSNAYSVVSGPTAVLKPFRAYWVRAFAPCVLELNVPGARSATITRDVLEKNTSIQVAVRSGDRAEVDNYAPVTGFDKTRLALTEKPPYVENFVSVKFLPTEGITLPAGTRAASTNKTMVAFEVQTDRKNSDVTVFFPNASHIGRKTEGTVVDLSNGTTRNISTGNLTYNTGENTQARRFALLVDSVKGTERLFITNIATTGRGSALSFSYNVSVSATLRATITSQSGSTVRDLDKGRSVTRGTNSLVWDGKDSRGVSVPSGSYMLKLIATDDKGNQATAIAPIVITR